MRSPELPAGTGLALAVLLVLGVVAVLGERGDEGGGKPVPPSAAALSVYDGRSPSEPGGSEQRVLVELPRPALADRDDLESLSAAEQTAYVRSLEREGTALRSALDARGVELRDAVPFGRTWDGFAATVGSSDLASLSSLGVRARPVRRFYPAASEPVPVPSGGASPSQAAAPPAGQLPVAVLDTGADPRAPALRGRLAPGFDALDRDSDPAPGADVRTPSRRETTGTALAELLAAAGERVLTIRVAGYGSARPEIHGTTDTLLAGLERAVDPNGDGAVDDAVAVALVGVNAPYAAFADSAEAQSVRGAGRLGTLVVAPAGNEGPARPPNGVVGSPGAARSALAAGATEAGAGVARVAVTIGKRELRGAAALGGAPPGGGGRLSGPVTSTDTAALLRGRVKLSGAVALVRAGPDPVAQATAAAGAGARAILLADPRDRPLPMMPAGRVAAPVIGLTGAAAEAALGAKGKVKFGRVTIDRPKGGGGTPSGGTPSGGTPSGGTPSGGTPSGGSPSGGTPSGGTPSGGTPSGGTPSGGTPSGGTPSGGTPSGGTPSGGTRSGGTPSGGAASGGATSGGGPAPFSSRGPAFDGTPKPDALAEGAAVTEVGLIAGTAVAAARLAVRAARLARERPAETPAGLRAALVPPAAAEAGGAPPAPAVPLGPLVLTRRGEKVVGVRFALGAFERGDPLAGGTRIEPAARLELELVDARGAVEQRLTPPEGARDLLPAEYAYRLPAKALDDLAAGEYRFRATARAPRREQPRTRRSPAFTVR